MCKCTKSPDPGLKDWGCGTMVEHLSSMSKDLGSKGEKRRGKKDPRMKGIV